MILGLASQRACQSQIGGGGGGGSTFSAVAGATELMRGWKVAQKFALLAVSIVGERGIGIQGHALAVGPFCVAVGPQPIVVETKVVHRFGSKASLALEGRMVPSHERGFQ
jgi:hypothetical protein